MRHEGKIEFWVSFSDYRFLIEELISLIKRSFFKSRSECREWRRSVWLEYGTGNGFRVYISERLRLRSMMMIYDLNLA